MEDHDIFLIIFCILLNCLSHIVHQEYCKIKCHAIVTLINDNIIMIDVL